MNLEELHAIATPIIEEAHLQGKDDDTIKMELMAAKIPFSKLNAVHKAVSIELGILVDPKEVTANLNEKIASVPWGDYETWDEVESVAQSLVENVDGATPQRAYALIRSFCREEEIKLPSRPRGGGGGPRTSKLAEIIVAMVVADPQTDVATAYAAIHEHVGGAHRHRNTLYYVFSTFAVAVAAATGSTLEDVVKNLRAQPEPAPLSADPDTSSDDEGDDDEDEDDIPF